VRALDAGFDRQWCVFGPYVFADLADVSESDGQAAIDIGKIEATGIRYVAGYAESQLRLPW
jgi:hypothetical protein